ncbi:hypothetical protein [Paenibacillus sp. OV219]|uniref:hypothetical protein n=1 Tax=Paenibacillus sp. OV219 TaxID=1884377 RepID=UPI0008AB6898|nr:hypothetical protein [Paenibacillus sp. OV219]SEN19265.1 hypothetical protein SAMN05518847_102381 [Paenibacillus sp. OV219]
MTNNNDVVLINFDRPRELRFGHKALKMYQALTGTSIEDMGKGGFNFEEIERLVYAGLLSDARANKETITIEQVEDWLDDNDIQDTISKVSEALSKAFGSADPNGQAVGRKKAR